MTVTRAPRRRAHTRASITLTLAAATLVASLALGGSAQAVTPTTVLLGTAGQFAVLAGTGITNGGATTISGDTGSSATPTEVGFAACPAAACVTQVAAAPLRPL